MIPRSELSKAAFAAGVSEVVQEKDYVLAWLLRAVAERADERLVFKGGTALRRCHIPGYRYSEDLDFTVVGQAPASRLLRPVADSGRSAHAVVNAVRNVRDRLVE